MPLVIGALVYSMISAPTILGYYDCKRGK